PGYWDVAAGGMVQADETYAESAARELKEELGVSGVELTAHDHFFFEDTGNRHQDKEHHAHQLAENHVTEGKWQTDEHQARTFARVQ
ncbi:NUDIX domain-containing protein, partial [Pseudomonas brassicacearum]|uniref:NUDIX domain-containing protein n=1 Tax=Pseudomonas brassicacearum TaxID=930166 RepID=UPI0016137FD6